MVGEKEKLANRVLNLLPLLLGGNGHQIFILLPLL
jgi:hypothetical protein